MVHYIGLDVSLKKTSICVVNQAGSVVREGVVDSEPEAIAAFVRSKAPGAVRVGLETGPTATWLWSELKQLGLHQARKANSDNGPRESLFSLQFGMRQRDKETEIRDKKSRRFFFLVFSPPPPGIGAVSRVKRIFS